MAKKADDSPALLTCGLIMPISTIDGCSVEHWMDVKSIIVEAIDSIVELNFKTKIVSDQDDVGVIQKRIVQNIYDSDIVVCDVSCKNANVMFELGMRLAFDKPTILIKDDQTDFSFDTGVIEHLVYPRDLRFSRIVNFKSALAEKVLATYRAASSNSEYTTFLKYFGSFKIAGIDQSVVSADQAILTSIQDLSRDVSVMSKRLALQSNVVVPSTPPPQNPQPYLCTMFLKGASEKIEKLLDYLAKTMPQSSFSELPAADGSGIALKIHSSQRVDGEYLIKAATRFNLDCAISR